MLIDARNGLKINSDRIDWVAFNPEIENTSYSVCVNTRVFTFTKDEYDNLGI